MIRVNDVFFNKYTAEMLDERAKNIIWKIDNSEMVEKYAIKSRFDGGILNIDKLSTGCKTVLNVMYNPEKIFDICECGENAVEIIYSLNDGRIYCEYPMIAFDMQAVEAVDNTGIHVFNDYEGLKLWWKDED